MNRQLWWFVARAGGLMSWILCTLAVVWGMALSTRLLGKRPTPARLLDLHRFLGALATIFAAVHVAALVADGYVHFGVVEVLVPLASSWKPGPVAWGIAGFYLLLAVELTSLARRRLPVRLWRSVHMTSVPLWALSTAHLLTAGTDAGNAAVWAALLVSTAAVLFVTVVRILSPGRRRSAPGLNEGQPAMPISGSGQSGVLLGRPDQTSSAEASRSTTRRRRRPGGSRVPQQLSSRSGFARTAGVDRSDRRSRALGKVRVRPKDRGDRQATPRGPILDGVAPHSVDEGGFHREDQQ